MRILLNKALGPNERWITVHPHGEEPGQPLLVQDQPDGSMKVIGGAGGSMNHMKLTPKGKDESTADAVARRQQEAKEKRQAQTEQDKAAGIHGEKQAARKALKEKRGQARAEFVDSVADLMGWDKSKLEFPADKFSHLSDKAQAKLKRKFEDGLYRQAKKAVDQGRDWLVHDHAARADAGIGEMPLATPDDETVSVQDLDPIKPAGASLGFATEYAQRADEKGASKEAVAEEAAESDGSKPALGQSGDVAKEIEAVGAGDVPELSLNIPDAKKAIAMVASQKKLRLQLNKIAEASKTVDKAKTAPKVGALDVEVSPDALTKAARAQIEDDVGTAATRAFLSASAEMGTDQMRKHIGVGAYNAVSGVSLAISGATLMDRSVVDVLGVTGASRALARRMKSDLTPEQYEKLQESLKEYHAGTNADRAQKALDTANEAKKVAESIDLDQAVSLEEAQALNETRRQAIEDARSTLGTAYGELEATAAMVSALGAPGDGPLDIPMGAVPTASILTQLHAIGLDKGDYLVKKVGAERVLSVSPEGLDKLTQPISAQDLEQVSRNVGIMRGAADEDNWLPEGFADRRDLSMNVEPGVVAPIAQPFTPGPDLEKSVKDYIGGRAADGDAPADIMADLLSESFLQKVPESQRADLMSAIDAAAPMKMITEGGSAKYKRADDLKSEFEGYADQYVKGLGGEMTPLHRQDFGATDTSVDALHRALAETPEGVAAYKDIADLSHAEQRGLRDYFFKNVVKESPEAQNLRQKLDTLSESEPERFTQDMFGEMSQSPEWADWKKARDELAEKVNDASTSWPKFVKAMRTPAAAYSAIQDVVRSQVSKSFHGHYNKLNPDQPLRVGKASIRGGLNFLDAVDPEARAARQKKEQALVDSLRNRSGGKYASGSVADKLDAAKEQSAAMDEAQMGFFSSEELPKDSDDAVGPGDRYTLGHAAESRIAGMMGIVGPNFKPGQPTKLWAPSMNGKYVAQQRAIKMFEANKRLGLAFGAGCVDGATILTCEKTGRRASVYDWWKSKELPWVKAFDKRTGRFVKKQSSELFVKGYEEMLKVSFANGASFVAARNHRIFDGEAWNKIGNLSVGDAVPIGGEPIKHQDSPALLSVTQTCHSSFSDALQPDAYDPDLPGTIPSRFEKRRQPSVLSPVVELFLCAHRSTADGSFDFCPPVASSPVLPQTIEECGQSAHLEGALHSSRIAQGFEGHCSAYLHPCDGQLRKAQAGGQSFSPLPVYGQGRTLLSGNSGGWDDEPECNHPYLSSFLPARKRSAFHPGRRGFFAESHDASCGSGLFVGLLEKALQFQKKVFFLHDKAGKADQDQCELSCLFEPSRKTPVVNIEKVGCRIVFDITVPDYHNYVAHGVIHHNSGKTPIMLGAFSHLKSKGKIKRSIMLVPSIVQGQFGGEALRYLKPGTFKWHANPGASRAERIAAYKDPKTDFVVQTHQSFRDDMLWLGAQREGVEPSEMSDKLAAMPEKERKGWMKNLMEQEGIQFDASMADEAHDTLNRKGKKNSSLANVTDALSGNTPYYIYASGDPAKNDASEVFDLMHKCDPERYADRDAFLRKYGVDTLAAKDALKREMSRYVFSSTIKPDIDAKRETHTVSLSGSQDQALKDLNSNFAKARKARQAGKVDLAALKAISPSSFEGVSAADEEAVGKQLQKSLGILRESSQMRIINAHPDSAKLDETVKIANANKGKQGVVFAHSRAAVQQTADRLKKEGYRVVVVTGSDSAKDKDAKRRQFTPGDGSDPQADIMVASDAAAVGMNLQSGQYLIQHDTPETAKNHGQRNARINRIGQMHDVQLHDLVADHPAEHRARKRLERKYGLRNMMLSPVDALDDSGIAGFLQKQMSMGGEHAGG